MSIRLKKEDFLKKEKLEVPETLKEELVNDEYDLDSFGDAFIMMPKMEEDKRQQNLEKITTVDSDFMKIIDAGLKVSLGLE